MSGFSFNFGGSSSSSSTSTSAAPSFGTGFNFGASAATSDDKTKPSFGSSDTTPSSSPSFGFSFAGSSSSSSSASSTAAAATSDSAVKPAFAFGGSTAPAFAFGSSAAATTSAAPSFGFGAASSTNSAPAATGKPKLEKQPAAAATASSSPAAPFTFNAAAPAANPSPAKSLFAAAALTVPAGMSQPSSPVLAPKPTLTKSNPPSFTSSSSPSPAPLSHTSSTASMPDVAIPSRSDAGNPSRSYFSDNLKHHPIWSHLASLGAFELPARLTDPTSPTKTPPTPSNPLENRMAVSFAGTMFLLVPPPSPSKRSELQMQHPREDSPNHARLYFLDLKPLKTSHLQSQESQSHQHRNHAPAYRELICTPSPLPSHSHSIQLNSQATYAAIHSTNTVYLVGLASNKLEKAVMYSDSTQSDGNSVSSVKVKAASVGSWFHQNNSTLQILQVSFHPLSDIHLLILTNDSVLRIYNIKENLNLPIKEFNLTHVSMIGAPEVMVGSGMSRSGSRMGSRKGSGAGFTRGSSLPQPKPMVTAFSFGSQPATRSAAVGTDNNSWDLFSIYFLFSNGHISLLCPYVPPHVSLDRRLVLDLIRTEQMRLNEFSDSINNLSGVEQPNEPELEQIQARLLWLSQTFGHVEDPATIPHGHMPLSNFVITREHGSIEIGSQGWIQPAQACGAYANSPSMPSVQSSSSLAAPSFYGNGANANANSGPVSTAHPYPASHLFAFRHAGTAAPGRFFRGFLDGRLDLLLRLIPVRPFFATACIKSLCEEIDDLSSNNLGFEDNSALEELTSLLAVGGIYESYSITAILTPADTTKLDQIELPVVAPTSNLAGLSSASRPNSFTPLSRMGSYGVHSLSRSASAAAHMSHVATPLQLFLPLYRPLVDLYDSNGVYIVNNTQLRGVNYGGQIDEISAVLARNEEDVFVSVQDIFRNMHSTQKALSGITTTEDKPRRLVGCVLLNDPLLGKFVIHLAASSAEPALEVLELVRPQQRTASVKSIIAAATSASSDPNTVVVLRTQSSDEDVVPISSFAKEIAPFLDRFRNFQPPGGFSAGVKTAVGKGSLLDSPEAFGEFLRIREIYIDTIQELTILDTKLRARVELLGKFSAKQQQLFDDVEKNIIHCRANQASLEEKIKLHKEMQTHLGESIGAVASEIQLSLTDLSPAELAFHRELAQLRQSAVPQLQHKLEELDSKTEQIGAIQQQMKLAAKRDADRGMSHADSKTVWSEKQLLAIKPVIENQERALHSLVAQISELHKTMATLRANPVFQPRKNSDKRNQPLLTAANE